MGGINFGGWVRGCCPLLGDVARYVLLLACFFLWFWWGGWGWLGVGGYGLRCCNVSGAVAPLARRGGVDCCFFAGAGCCPWRGEFSFLFWLYTYVRFLRVTQCISFIYLFIYLCGLLGQYLNKIWQFESLP